MKYKYLFTFITFVLIVSTFSNAQVKFSKSELINDLDILKSNLEQNHAGLYTYSTKKQIDSWFDKAKEQVKDSMNRFEFYRILSPLNSIIKNGHTNVDYPKFGKNFYLLPIQLYKYKNTFHVIGAFNEEYNNLIGQEIIEIDGKPILKVFNNLLISFTRDGENLTKPSEELIHDFGLAYSLAYGSHSKFKVTLVDKNNSTIKTLKSAILFSGGTLKHYNTYVETGFPSFEIKDNVGILTFSSFDVNDLKKDKYKLYLDESFKTIKNQGIQHLIVDVRNNGGGRAEPTQELISYLVDKEFILYEDIHTITKSIKDKKYYMEQSIFWVNLFSWLKIKKIGKNKFRPRNDTGIESFSPKKNNFKGHLYILTNGFSFSATGEFASFMKHNSDAVFIGEEVGGNKIQNTSGVSFEITLPNSKQQVEIPIVEYKMNVSEINDGHGVVPDYWVKNRIEDKLNKNDSVMNFTLNLIKKSMAKTSSYEK